MIKGTLAAYEFGELGLTFEASSDSAIDYVRKSSRVEAANLVGASAASERRRDLARLEEHRQSGLRGSSVDYVKIQAHAARARQAGNCDELAAVAYAYLYNTNVRASIEYVHGDNFGHAFVVIGRNTRVSIDDLNGWDSDAVICDAWIGESLTLHDFFARMRTAGCVPEDGSDNWEFKTILASEPDDAREDDMLYHPSLTTYYNMFDQIRNFNTDTLKGQLGVIATNWKSNTSRFGHWRSGDLKAVDVALAEYARTKDPEDLKKLKTVFSKWYKANPKERTKRNYDKCVQRLKAFLQL